VLQTGGTSGAALNAADEVAVEWFLAGKISFVQIPRIVEHVLDRHEVSEGESIEALLAVDRAVRDRLEQEQSRWVGE
jgi:1-deoxy-D-xylulose-5-phosphate reductoisomerase